MFRLERRLLDLGAELDIPWRLSGREEARRRAEAAAVQAELYAAYAEVYGTDLGQLDMGQPDMGQPDAEWAAEPWDHEVPEPPLRVRGLRLGQGGMFWAAGEAGCPHLAWDGQTLRPSAPLLPAFGEPLLGGALRILFERWQVGRVQLGGGGPVLRRREWFERTGVVRGP